MRLFLLVATGSAALAAASFGRQRGSSAMGLQDEYAAIAQGMELGTLRPAPVEPPPTTWISSRFSNGPSKGFGEIYDSKIMSSVAFSMGKCSRGDAKRVFVSRELAKYTISDISPGPQAYKGPCSLGPKGLQHHLSTQGRSPNTVFGTDLRNSADLREYKSCGIDVDRELAALREHATQGWASSTRHSTTR